MPIPYDLLVIGSGSGLSVASKLATEHNFRVAVIESGPIGGTCLNRGCIPSKMLIHVAEVLETINTAKQFGIDASVHAIDFARITNRVHEMVDEESRMLEENIRDHPRIDLYTGIAQFVASKEVLVADTQITADRVLIAAGARPFVPPIPGIESVEYWTSTEALRQNMQPSSLIIIGGGYIGMELGHFYGNLGTDVTVIEMLDLLLAREDHEIAETFTQLFSKKYPVYLKSKIEKVSQKADGTKVVTCITSTNERKDFEAEALLLVTGTKPNSDTLHLENTKVAVNERGYIQVDEYLQTTEENVWALGDIVGKAPFKHGANYEANIILNNIVGNEKMKADYSVMPHAVFSSPQVAGVGLTEEQVKESGIPYEVRKKEYIKTGMGQAMQAHEGFVKFIINPTDETILGCHIIGPHASTLIQEVVLAMSTAGAKTSAIKNSIHIHPALTEVVQRAL